MAVTTTHNSYGAPVSFGVKQAAESKYRKRLGMVYPQVGSFSEAIGNPAALKNNVSEGGYFGTSYGVELIRNNLRQLLLCGKGERVMLPNFGLDLRKYLFEPLDETTYFLIKSEILSTLHKYFSSLNIINLSVLSPPSNADKHELLIKLTLQVLDESQELFDVEVKVA